MPATYNSLATAVGTGSSAIINFGSFSGYTDLRIIVNQPSRRSIFMTYNNDTGGNYSNVRYLYVPNNGSGYSDKQDNQSNVLFTTNQSDFIMCDIMNYANTSAYKTSFISNNQTTSAWGIQVATWRSTSAITSITITGDGNFTSNDFFTLYGIAAA